MGFLRLVFYWKPNWMLLCTHKQCGLGEATSILLRDKYQQWFVENVETVLKPNRYLRKAQNIFRKKFL